MFVFGKTQYNHRGVFHSNFRGEIETREKSVGFKIGQVVGSGEGENFGKAATGKYLPAGVRRRGGQTLFSRCNGSKQQRKKRNAAGEEMKKEGNVAGVV